MSNSNSKRIAKNTIFLYARMFLIMIVTLYTSRVTLQVLGISDFGIYQTVGGVVTFLSFIGNVLGSGTSRFITYEMGRDKPQLGILFSTVRIAHLLLGIIIFFLGEIIGTWFLIHKLVIPNDRFEAALFTFHMSMLTTFFKITQIPYNAILVAYEKMNIYAYISLIEAILDLAIVYVLQLFLADKLKLYSILMAGVTVFILLLYRIYCRQNFIETKAKFQFDTQLFKSIALFSSWSLLSSASSSVANQGVTIVTNMFFSPTVVTVRSLSLKINSVINQFINNFRTAVNPQIVKYYAANEYEKSKKLALISTKYTYFLVLFLVEPFYHLVDPVLMLWLGDVPAGLSVFVRFTLLQGLFQAFDSSLYVPIYASGQIKENAIISPLCEFLELPVVYVLFKAGFKPIIIAVVEMLLYFSLGVIIKPVLVHRIVRYSFKETYSIIINCFFVTALSSILPSIISEYFDSGSLTGFFVILIISLLSVATVVWLIGFDKEMRLLLTLWAKQFFFRKEK